MITFRRKKEIEDAILAAHELVNNVFGHEIELNGHQREKVVAKTMMIYMLMDKFTITELAYGMKLHHSTIIHYKRRVKDILTFGKRFEEWDYFEALKKYEVA